MCLAFMNSCAYLGDCCRIYKPFGPRQQKISFPIDLITESDIWGFKCTRARTLMLQRLQLWTGSAWSLRSPCECPHRAERNSFKHFTGAVRFPRGARSKVLKQFACFPSSMKSPVIFYSSRERVW